MEKKRLVDILNINPPPETPMVSNNITKAKQTYSRMSLLEPEHEEEEDEDDDDDNYVTSGTRYSRFSTCFRGFGRSKTKLSDGEEERSGSSSSRTVMKALSMRQLSMTWGSRQRYRKVDHQWDKPLETDNKRKANIFESCKRFLGV